MVRPRMPVGLTISTMIRSRNTTASFQTDRPMAETSTSAKPTSRPPMTAPGMEPMPPKTAATKALVPSMMPMVGVAWV